MAGGISPQAPNWPALYNPAVELDGFEQGPTQPSGFYLTDANDIFRYTFYWTLILYSPLFVVCGIYAFVNIVFPPHLQTSPEARPSKSRTLSSFSFSSRILSGNGLRRTPPRPAGPPHHRLHSPLVATHELDEHEEHSPMDANRGRRPPDSVRDDIELTPINETTPDTATFLYPRSPSPSPSFHSFPPTPRITISPEASRPQSRSHHYPYRASISQSRRSGAPGASGPFLAHQPKNPRRSRLTYAILVLLTFLAASVGSAVVESAIVGYLLAGLYSAGQFEMSTWVPFIWAFIIALTGALGIFPSVIHRI